MIEVNDARFSHYIRAIRRERSIANRASNAAVRELHAKIADMYERELATIRSLS